MRMKGIPYCDSVGIQTQDLQNRNLTLYSAKLRDPKPHLAATKTCGKDPKRKSVLQMQPAANAEQN